MRINLRQVVFCITLLCIGLAVFRRPLLGFAGGDWSLYLQMFFLAFYHWLWLFSVEGLVSDAVEEIGSRRPQVTCELVLLFGVVSSICMHMFFGAFAWCAIGDIWAWCSDKEPD